MAIPGKGKEQVLLLGAHVSIAGGVFNAFIQGEALGCTTIQIFTKSSNQWRAKELGKEELEHYHAEQKRTGIKPVIAHDSYLINLASPVEALVTKSREAFLLELQRCEAMKIPYLVTHPGSHTGAGEESGINKIIESINWLHKKTEDFEAKIALELTAGQGATLGCTFGQIADMIEKSDHPDRLMVCLDTCHIFAAGYDIRTEDSYRKTIEEFDRIIGLKRLAVVHLNDSKKGLGSRVDRHEHIGRGEIGTKAFELIMKDKRMAKIPKLLETPKADDMDRVNLALLRKLAQS